MRRYFATAALLFATTACGVSTEDEVALGADYAAQINQQLPIVDDPEINRYVNVLGDSLARLSDDRGLDWTFYVVNSPEVNAFAVPGGFIYVNRGLIQRTSTMNELAGVLGHEIGHVVERHSVEQMQKAQGANLGVTLACVLTRICDSQAGAAAIQVGGTALFAKFSRDDELEADRHGVRNTIQAGINPQGIVTMFQTLIAERNRQPDAVSGWFSTHPLEEDRIAQVQEMIQGYDAAILRGLATDSRNYQAFKSRLASLPAAPSGNR
jgi:beta-barrel assembly-enhancing protease